jgi:hypothetical protein
VNYHDPVQLPHHHLLNLDQAAYLVRDQGLALGFPLRSHTAPFLKKNKKMPRSRAGIE